MSTKGRQSHLLNLTLAICLLGSIAQLRAQPFAPGEISPNFTLADRKGTQVSLYDFSDHVIVLDFFAFWCAPCSVSSPDIERNIQKHYDERGGTPNGVPVQVISINLEPESPESTDAFAEKADLDLVVHDEEMKTFQRYNLLGDRPSIPLFVIINGVQNSPSHAAWEVLHTQHGMYVLPNQTTAQSFRSVISSVAAPSVEPMTNANPFLDDPEIGQGWKISPWFGRLNDRHYPWIFHESLEWRFVRPARDDHDGIYLYHPGNGWTYTSPPAFPRVYHFETTQWSLSEPVEPTMPTPTP